MKKTLYPAIFAAITVFLVNVNIVYINNDLSLKIKIIVNMLAATIGAILGAVVVKRETRIDKSK
ncbi:MULTISPECIES: hypothetical protein [Ureibacillus]|jgi:hypothetical protein|uniref:Uncharacterized protein n=1 Tax=Ureibacillus thermosphaericus TaxID=51173 RepID=A0A840Q0Y8_URETH|nr:hypothetical protein [Ureibacillus thermosphaericus]MBB5150128.1 hypothetical protein [Ureibacillus thermosphaericus]NKZ32715.1 hypothetical protein [Ureibacillus thermosphaericus]